MIVPDPNFRPNAERAIYIQGVVDEQMVNRLAPRIILLQSRSRAPITVYIDSRGGSVASAEAILRLLSASNQNEDPPCRIITVAIGRASSAAAVILSSGNYAIAVPECIIFYHGVRQALDNPITVEYGSALTESLKISNDQSAMALARKTEWRFMFRFVNMMPEFDGVRQKSPSMSDLDCFVALTIEKLSPMAKGLINRARERHERYKALLDRGLVPAFKSKAVQSKTGQAMLEATVLKKIIGFEMSSHKKEPNWTFLSGGLARLNDDFLILNEYIVSVQSEQFKRVCNVWGDFALTPQERAELAKIPEEAARKKAKLDRVRPKFQPLFSFLVALCHALQEGEENYLTARDAFWLGLIDEVIGVDLPSYRLIEEYIPDPPAIPATAPQVVAKSASTQI